MDKVVEIFIPVIMAAWKVLGNKDVMNAIFKSDKITPEQIEIITKLRKATVQEFDDLKPTE